MIPATKTPIFWEWFRQSDAFTKVILFLVIGLAVRGLYLFFRRSDRASLRRYAALTLLPLLLGLVGVFTLTYWAQSTLVYGDFGDPLEIVAPKVFALARRPLFVGLAGTGCLLLMAVFGWLRAGSYQSDGTKAALGAPRSSS
jgi:hypothetical protein